MRECERRAPSRTDDQPLRVYVQRMKANMVERMNALHQSIRAGSWNSRLCAGRGAKACLKRCPPTKTSHHPKWPSQRGAMRSRHALNERDRARAALVEVVQEEMTNA